VALAVFLVSFLENVVSTVFSRGSLRNEFGFYGVVAEKGK